VTCSNASTVSPRPVPTSPARAFPRIEDARCAAELAETAASEGAAAREVEAIALASQRRAERILTDAEGSAADTRERPRPTRTADRGRWTTVGQAPLAPPRRWISLLTGSRGDPDASAARTAVVERADSRLAGDARHTTSASGRANVRSTHPRRLRTVATVAGCAASTMKACARYYSSR
jgi:hypothetical protein